MSSRGAWADIELRMPGLFRDRRPAHERRLDFREKLGRAPRTRADKLVPWLWRQWKALAARESALYGHPMQYGEYASWGVSGPLDLLSAWFIGSRPRPNLDRFDWYSALHAASNWEEDEREKQDRKKWVKLWKKQGKDFIAAFTPVHIFADGSRLGVFAAMYPPPYGLGHIDLMPLRAVGGMLGHCYKDEDTANLYATRYTMAVLFKDGEPQVTFAIKRGSDTIAEIKGIWNRFPDREWWSHVAQVVFGDPDIGFFEEIEGALEWWQDPEWPGDTPRMWRLRFRGGPAIRGTTDKPSDKLLKIHARGRMEEALEGMDITGVLIP